jgi:hypothetical protein
MHPVDFKESNATLVKPENMTAEECGDLRGRLIPTFRGSQYTTCWEANYEDIELLNNGQALIIEFHSDEYIYTAINTQLIQYPALQAHKSAVVWLPGADDMFNIKSGKPIYITFLSVGFPVISVYVKEK